MKVFPLAPLTLSKMKVILLAPVTSLLPLSSPFSHRSHSLVHSRIACTLPSPFLHRLHSPFACTLPSLTLSLRSHFFPSLALLQPYPPLSPPSLKLVCVKLVCVKLVSLCGLVWSGLSLGGLLYSHLVVFVDVLCIICIF